MALEFAHGSIQWLAADPAGTLYTVPTLGFEAKAIRVYWVGLQSNSPTNANSQAVSERRGVGFWTPADGNYAVATFSADASGSADCGSVCSISNIALTVTGAGVIDGTLQLAPDVPFRNDISFSVIDPTPVNLTIFYEIWGGSDIVSAKAGLISEPATTGIQNYGAPAGFGDGEQPSGQVIMFAGVQSVSNPDVGEATDSGLNVGFATGTGTSQQITVCGNSDDGSPNMDTDGYNYTGECLSMIVLAGGNPNARATLSAIGGTAGSLFGVDSFNLNWLARGTTDRKNIFLSIKGGSWRAGSYTIAGNTLNSTTTVQEIPFVPKGICLLGAMKTQSTVANSTIQDRIGFGTALVDPAARTTFTRNAAGVLDEDGTANSEIDLSIYYDQSLVFPSNAGALQASYGVTAMGSSSFTVQTTTAGGVANEWQGYLVFGDNPSHRTVSVGHPFII